MLEAEASTPIENLSSYATNFEAQLPKLKGSKAHAISGIIRDVPESPSVLDSGIFLDIPEVGVSHGSEIDPEELEPHFFVPNFLRPLPEAEEDPEIDSDLPYDVSNDVRLKVPLNFNYLGSPNHSWNAT